jgi:hypothetical protein
MAGSTQHIEHGQTCILPATVQPSSAAALAVHHHLQLAVRTQSQQLRPVATTFAAPPLNLNLASTTSLTRPSLSKPYYIRLPASTQPTAYRLVMRNQSCTVSASHVQILCATMWQC